MKPGLLPLMLLRESYETTAFVAPSFPVDKSVTIIGAAGLSMAVIGPSGLTMEIPQ